MHVHMLPRALRRGYWLSLHVGRTVINTCCHPLYPVGTQEVFADDHEEN